MAARRAQQAKQSLASNSNLSSAASAGSPLQANKARLKSTSMTNLVASSALNGTSNSNHQANNTITRIQRPASRNALDQIHKGMNAKFTHVQSKVLLQNIRPQQQQQQQQASKIPATKPERLTPTTPSSTLRRSTPTTGAATPSAKIQLSDRSQLINKIKALQEELERHERQRDELQQELERERADKTDQVQQAKLELQERVAEGERQNEEYHQKLLEAYELADQNRRAADGALGQREELRKKVEELEQQLAELKEFVAMKEEMMGKMGELREQIKAERERYEEKTRSLHQMFENEKLSSRASRSMQVDQNSNYFRRAKPSLQSSESINSLDDNGQYQANPNYHQSEHDLYGSKLSTRMHDGARLAWKKSRKFASSVITGSLSGLSACRRHNATMAGRQDKRAGSGVAGCETQGETLQVVGGGAELANQRSHHTSVVEVGPMAGDFIAHHHQQQQQQPAQQSPLTNEAIATIHHQTSNFNTREPATSGQMGQQQQQQQQQQKNLIRVDENNKLTIVTKFSGHTAATSQQASPASEAPADCRQQGASASPTSERSCSERSRCESSSSGRGTASDSGNNSGPGSHNGDHPDQSLDQQQDVAGAVVAKTLADGNHGVITQQPSGRDSSHHQRHKRKSSLFKASAFSGSQASLNKTLKSFFALASSKATSSSLSANTDHNQQGQPAIITRHVQSYDGATMLASAAGQRAYTTEVFVETTSGRPEPSAVARAASTPTSSLKSSSLTDSDRTITGELSSDPASERALKRTATTAQANNTTTTKILNEFVRYEDRPEETTTTTTLNAERRATSDANANELNGKRGQGEDDERRAEDVATTTMETPTGRFGHHHHLAAVTVEH